MAQCRRWGLISVGLCIACAVVCGTAWADPTIEPPIATAGKPQSFTLVVPEEQPGAALKMVELYPPPELAITSCSETDGWHRDWTIVSMQVPVQKATWTRIEASNDDPYYATDTTASPNERRDVTFRFVATPDAAEPYPVEVRETYANGKVIHWRGTTSYAFPVSPPGATTRPPIVLGASATNDGRPYVWIAAALGATIVLAAVIGLGIRARRTHRASQ